MQAVQFYDNDTKLEQYTLQNAVKYYSIGASKETRLPAARLSRQSQYNTHTQQAKVNNKLSLPVVIEQLVEAGFCHSLPHVDNTTSHLYTASNTTGTSSNKMRDYCQCLRSLGAAPSQSNKMVVPGNKLYERDQKMTSIIQPLRS